MHIEQRACMVWFQITKSAFDRISLFMKAILINFIFVQTATNIKKSKARRKWVLFRLFCVPVGETKDKTKKSITPFFVSACLPKQCRSSWIKRRLPSLHRHQSARKPECEKAQLVPDMDGLLGSLGLLSLGLLGGGSSGLLLGSTLGGGSLGLGGSPESL